MNAKIDQNNFGQQRHEVVRANARFLQLELWNKRFDLWSRDVPESPIDILQPGVALMSRGFSVETRESLGEEWESGLRAEVAGIVDRERRTVYVSAKYPFVVQNFTLAHELAHVILHPHVDVKHRELPKDGPGRQKGWEEREADWFATAFLMPERQIRKEFSRRFAAAPFRLTDDSAFALCNSSVDKILKQIRLPRDLSKILSDATVFGGVSFPSLASRFAVSSKAMAIRLDELKLVDFSS